MLPENDPLTWVEYAETDLEVARRSLLGRRKLAYPAAFPAQQCAEKYLKALLVWREQEPPRTHDLRQLYELCQRQGVIVAIEAERLDALSVSAVQTRYPGDPVTVKEAREGLATAKMVRDFARKLLGLRSLR